MYDNKKTIKTAAIVIGLFLLSPMIQFFRDMIFPPKVINFMGTIGYVCNYPTTVLMINTLALITFIVCMVYFVKSKKMFDKTIVSKTFPFLLLFLMFVWMVIAICITGFNDNALMGDDYINESLISYFVYVCGSFLLAMLLYREDIKEKLLFLLSASSLFLAIFSLIDIWFVPVRMFRGISLAASFQNSNHYGYYLAVCIIVSGMLYTLDESASLVKKLITTSSFTLNVVVLLINDTLGSYLSVCVVLFFALFLLWHRGMQVRIKIIFLIFSVAFLTFILGLFYDTVMSGAR